MRVFVKAATAVSIFVTAALAGSVLEGQQRGQQAQQNGQPSAQLEILPIRDNLNMLAGAGANIALSGGPDGVLVVDTGTAQNADRVLAAVQQLQRQLATNGLQPWNYG